MIYNLWHLVNWDKSGLLHCVSKIIERYSKDFYEDFSFLSDETFFFFQLVTQTLVLKLAV